MDSQIVKNGTNRMRIFKSSHHYILVSVSVFKNFAHHPGSNLQVLNMHLTYVFGDSSFYSLCTVVAKDFNY